MITKNKYLLLEFFLIILILLGILCYTISSAHREQYIKQNFTDSKRNFLRYSNVYLQSLSSPISITGNDNFAQQAKIYGWNGNGSKSNPFIIENYNISSDNSFNTGIFISNVSVYFVIQDCYVYSLQYGYYGIFLNSTIHGLIINNTILHNVEGIKVNSSNTIIIQNNTLTGNQLYGIHLQHSSSLQVIENSIANNYNFGIRISSLNNSLLMNNLVIGNGADGIFISTSENITIYGNNIVKNFQYGISLDDSSNNNIITNCTIDTNGFYGIGLSYNKNTTIIRNIVKNNINGFYLLYSMNNSITENVITNNTGTGIVLTSLSENNTLFNNMISYNGYYGLEISQNSNFNSIYYNAFIGNNKGAIQAFTASAKNIWSVKTIGNFWSDYKGIDFNNDGIGDTPYIIDGGTGASDSYPLMEWDSYRLDKSLTFPQINTIIMFLLDFLMRESILGIFVIFLWTVITKKSIVNLTDDFHEIFIHYRLENTLSIKNIALSFFIFFVSIGSFFLLFEFFKRTWFGNGYSSDTIFVYIKLPISSYSTEILTLFSSFIIAPILEEVFFRGLLLHATETAKWSKKSLYLFQVVIFGIVHIPNHLELSMFYFIIYMTNICLLGFYFTWIMRKTRNLLYPIVAHCLWNIQVDGLNFFYNLGYIDITNTMYNFLIIIGIISLFLIIMYYIIKIINGLIILIKLEE